MKALLQLIEYQRANGMPVARHYRPGLSNSEIQRIEADSGLLLPSQLRELYSCRNGAMGTESTPMSELWIVPPYYWLNLEEAIAIRKEMAGQANEGIWANTLPLFSSGSADFIVFHLESGELSVFDLETGNDSTLAANISDFFTKILLGWQRGLIFLDDDGLPNVAAGLWTE